MIFFIQSGAEIFQKQSSRFARKLWSCHKSRTKNGNKEQSAAASQRGKQWPGTFKNSKKTDQVLLIIFLFNCFSCNSFVPRLSNDISFNGRVESRISNLSNLVYNRKTFKFLKGKAQNSLFTTKNFEYQSWLSH